MTDIRLNNNYKQNMVTSKHIKSTFSNQKVANVAHYIKKDKKKKDKKIKR